VSQNRALRMTDVAAYVQVSHQRIAQMRQEGKLPRPDRVDQIGPLWKPTTIEDWAEREWWDTRPWRKRPEKVRSRRNPKAPTASRRGS
jgi:predicted DNA-binding transcriptional regulator AlpA